MNYFDNELNIIEWFQSLDDKDVYFPNDTKRGKELYNSIHQFEEWQFWKYSYGKNDPPPDFYSEKHKIMIDVMRVDDHAYKNESGKLVNQVNMRESKIQSELLSLGIKKNFPNVNDIMVNAITDLKTEEDHNYTYYKNNFKDIVNKHINKTSLYRKNHNGYETVLFVFDESSAYFKSFSRRQLDKKREVGGIFKGEPHFFFWDDNFVKVFENSQIEFLIWCAPFKLLKTTEGIIPLPKAIVYDIKRLVINTKIYKDDMLMSFEL